MTHKFFATIVRCSVFVVCLASLPFSGVAQQVTSASPSTEKLQTKSPPDTLEFTNGDRLTGKLERATGGNVVFKSDMAGELTIPFSKIKELHSGTEFVALRKAPPGKIKPAGTGAVTFADANVSLQRGTEPAQTLPTSELGYLVDVPSYARAVDHHAGFLEGWNGAVTAGLTLVRSTEEATTFTGALNLVRAIPTVAYLPDRNRTTVDVTESYGRNATPVIPQTTPASPPVVVLSNIFHGGAERDEYFRPRLFALADVSFDHNYSQGLDLQQVYGAGLGWTPFQTPRQELDLRADAHFERQHFLATAPAVNSTSGAVQNNFNLFGSTFQENFRRTLPAKFVLTEWANILPAWNDTQAYTANAYLGISMPLFKRLSATVSATDNYLNNPAPGYRRNSVQFVTGVTYNLK